MKNLNYKNNLANLFKARFPFLYMTTWEEDRAIELIEEVVKDENLIKTVRKVYVWSQTEGIICEGNRINNGAKEAMEVLNFIEKTEEASVFILKDFHIYLGAQGAKKHFDVIRKIRDLSYNLKGSYNPKNVIFISPELVLPNELQKDITILDFELPTTREIINILDEMIEANKESGRINISLNNKEKEALAKAALGLTVQEAENAFARAMVEDGSLDINDLDMILNEKCQVIKKTGILEFVKADLNINDVGGLENLKRWIVKRNKSWSDEAKKYNLPAPKGVLITGVPGCGKSLTAKAISAMWKLPLLRLDMGKIFSGIVGSSEENMRKAIKTAEAVSPSILWIDEIEKGFGGINGSGDSGLSTRIFGTFLTWMQEKDKPVFVVATANNISNLPSEMLRKGRFDEIFFVDLPTKKERKEIFKLHINKKLEGTEIKGEINTSEQFLEHMANITEGFVGAEIEQSVIGALFEAFSEERNLEVKDLEKTIKNTVPLSITQKEQILAIRRWANIRAVAATAEEDRNEYSNENIEFEKKEIDSSSEELKKSRGGRTVDF
ncbi:AAA family ATPase [Clostridium perfringens]|uniref:AAA family ATPase n=1 Tax=Clostridium perfringens TaxID=1502 RepID=UPI000F8DC590|nr:AAA family ATPase [Clostridium perfringens]RUR41830.1 AAA family ATPase [Clostridium perfringens]